MKHFLKLLCGLLAFSTLSVHAQKEKVEFPYSHDSLIELIKDSNWLKASAEKYLHYINDGSIKLMVPFQAAAYIILDKNEEGLKLLSNELSEIEKSSSSVPGRKALSAMWYGYFYTTLHPGKDSYYNTVQRIFEKLNPLIDDRKFMYSERERPDITGAPSSVLNSLNQPSESTASYLLKFMPTLKNLNRAEKALNPMEMAFILMKTSEPKVAVVIKDDQTKVANNQLALINSLSFGQDKIDYGNNKEAGTYYKIRGINIYTEQYGSGKPLLMLHGNGGSISSMASIIPYFSQRYKVIAVDSRAHGKSIDNGDSLSFEMMADDEAALLDQMHIDSAYVIGWSDGGIVALLLAMRHPSKVAKLASTGANLWPDSTALIPSSWKSMKARYDFFKTKPRTTPKQKNEWKILLLDLLQPNISLIDLHTIQCPSLIISGDHDVIVLKHTVDIFQNIRNAWLWIVPNSGHATLIQHADDFDKSVNEFFEKVFYKR